MSVWGIKKNKKKTQPVSEMSSLVQRRTKKLFFMHLYPKSFGTHTCIFVVCKPFQTNSKLKRPTVLSAFKEDILYTTLTCWCRLYMSPKCLRFSLYPQFSTDSFSACSFKLKVLLVPNLLFRKWSVRHTREQPKAPPSESSAAQCAT